MIKFIIFDGTRSGLFINFLDAHMLARILMLDGIHVFSEGKRNHNGVGKSWLEFDTDSDLILFKLKYL